MNFIWENIASRVLQVTETLIEPATCFNIIDVSPNAINWWEKQSTIPCQAVPYTTFPQLQTLEPSKSTFIWVLPPATYFKDDTWSALLQSIRCVCQHYFLFATFGVNTQSTLERILEINTPMNAPDLHDLGDQLVQAGWQRPMVQSQSLTVHYKHSATLFKDLEALGHGPFHPLFFDVKGIEKGPSHVLKQPITLEINVCMAYNDASRQVQVTDKDGSVGIPLDQFIKKD